MASASEMLDSGSGGEHNLSLPQRTAYVGIGLGLAAAGAMPRPNPLLNVLALGVGCYLAWSGYNGRCPVKAALIDGRGDSPALGRSTGSTAVQA